MKPLPVPSPAATPGPNILFSFRRCPYAIRARMALQAAGIAVQVREVALRDKPRDLLLLSPKGTVPVLQAGDGQVLHESLDIMHWALRQSDPQDWLLVGDAQAVRSWVVLNDDGFKPLLDRYKYAERHPELARDGHRQRAVQAFVAPLDARLRTTQHLFGARPTWGDVALFPFMRQFAMVDQAWFDAAPLPGVQRWLSSWLSCALFRAVMHKATAPGNLAPG